MRILFLSAANSSHTVKWVNSLAARGHSILLVSLPEHHCGAGEIAENVEIEYLTFGKAAGYYLNRRQLLRAAKRFCPDVASVHYASGYGTLARVACLKNVLLTVWGSDVYDFPEKGFLQNLIVKRNLRYASAVSSSTAAMVQRAQELAGVKLKLFVTPFGIDTRLFAPRSKKEGDFVVGAVKRLEPESGLDILIEAFKIFKETIVKTFPDEKVRLVIIGEGSEHITLLGITKSLEIDDHAKLYGYMKNDLVPDALRQIDLVCLPSVRESYGVSALEAMACAKPLIVSDADGFKTTVKNGVNGIVISSGKPKDYAAAMCRLYADKKLREKLGQNARKTVCENFNEKLCGDKMELALKYAAAIQAEGEQGGCD